MSTLLLDDNTNTNTNSHQSSPSITSTTTPIQTHLSTILHHRHQVNQLLTQGWQHVDTTRYERVNDGPIKGFWIYPSPKPQQQHDEFIEFTEFKGFTMIYIHGGSYVFGDPRQTLGPLVGLCDVLRDDYKIGNEEFRVLSVEYPKGVDSGMGGGVQGMVGMETVFDVYRYLLVVYKVPAKRIILAGDETGATTTTALIQTLINRSIPTPSSQILISPVVNLPSPTTTTSPTTSLTTSLTTSTIPHALYLPPTFLNPLTLHPTPLALKNPLLSPSKASYDSMLLWPRRAFVWVGSTGSTGTQKQKGGSNGREEVLEFVGRMRKAGVRVRCVGVVDDDPDVEGVDGGSYGYGYDYEYESALRGEHSRKEMQIRTPLHQLVLSTHTTHIASSPTSPRPPPLTTSSTGMQKVAAFINTVTKKARRAAGNNSKPRRR
ncbi:hypothetical protein HK102_009623, partial [Quaeritorhiza haematococci]